MSTDIKHCGVVDEVEDGCVKVRIVQSSACASCKVASHCNASENKEKVVEVPVETAEEVPVEEPPAVEEEPVAVEPEVIIVEAEPELMHYGMEGWMLRLLVVSVAAIILFTAATAIRSGARRPMTKAVSLLLAVVFTAVPWAITILVAGASWFWCVYLVMLLSYIIFRSGNR